MTANEIIVEVSVNYSQLEKLIAEYLETLPRNVFLNIYGNAKLELDCFLDWMRTKAENIIESETK